MGAPATLPGDFFDKNKEAAPETLPANFFDKQTSVDIPPFPVDHVVNHQLKDLPPEEQADKRGKFASVLYDMAKPWMDAGYKASSGLNRGMAGLELELDAAARFLEHAGLGKSGGLFEGMAKESEANVKVMESLLEKEGVGATDKIFRFAGETAGQAAPGTAQFLLDWGSGLTIPFASAVTEARDRDPDADPTIAGLTKAAQVGMLGTLFKFTGPLKSWLRAGVLGTYFGAEEAIAAKPGEKAEGFLKGAATGGLLAITSPSGKYGIRDLYPEIERAAPVQSPVEAQIVTQPEPDGLRPAIQNEEGKVVAGKPGETHPDVIEKTGTEEANRGFVNPEGEFLSREQSKQWVKDNEPEIYDAWKDIAGADAEMHSQDYNLARDSVQASRRPLPIGAASALPIDNPPIFKPRTEPTGVWGAIGNIFHRMYKATTIDILPELSDAGVSNNAVQHAHAREAVPKMVDDLLSRVFPDEYKNPKKMAPFIDILNKDNILGGYDAFLTNALEARKAGDEAAAAKWDKLADKVKEAHDLDAYDAEVQKAKGNKKFMETVQRWQDNVSPRLDQLYNEMKQVDTFTQRDSRGRYLDSRINLLSEEHAARWTESLADPSTPMPGPSASSYRNPNVKRDPTDMMATFTGEYSTDARAVLSAVVAHRWNEVTKLRFYNDLVDSGTGIKAESGEQPPEGYTRMPFRVPQTDKSGHTSMVEQSLFVPKNTVSEIRSVLGTDMKLKQNVVGKILTGIQITQLADLTTHTKNIMSVVTRAQGAGDVWTDAVRKVPGIGSADAIWRIAKTTREVMQDTPEIRAEIADMAQRGLVRPEFPVTGIQKITRGQQIIHAADTSARVIMNRFFDNLAERKLVLDTEENRRNFVNQVGEYNGRLQGPIMRAMKEAGVSPFIVAGRNFNRQGRWALTGNPGVEASSMNAAVQMRVMNLLGTASLFTLPMMLNHLTTGKMQGRAGTPLGAWDLGQEPDEDGKHKAIDLLSWTGARRGMRSIGLDAMAKGLQNGDHMNDIIGNALQDAGNTVIHPWNGPAIAFAEKTATGKQLDLRGKMEAEQVPEGGGLQFLENFRAALESQNPLVYSIVRPAFQEMGLDQKVKPSYGKDVVTNLLKSPGQAIGMTNITPPLTELERLKHDIDVEKARMKKDLEYQMEIDRKKDRKRFTILKRRAAAGE